MSDTLCLHLAHDSAELLKQSVARTAGEEEEETKINLGSMSEGEGGDAATAAFISCRR